MTIWKQQQGQQQQRGVTMIISLIVLLMLTIIAITAVRMGTLDEKIVYNSTDAKRSFVTAESAMVTAGNSVMALTDTNSFTNSGGLYSLGNGPDPFASGTWTGTGVISGTSSTGSQTPKYFIELIGNVQGQGATDTVMNMSNYGDETGAVSASTVFRIVSAGTGASGNAQTLLEGYYWRTF